ncbi:Chromatin-remodeling ATPase INO80 [Psilocybe cubensis]|uniref:Chromatin-remodeling ATPase INO80 n=2 Tax=Psilocybe cubensis TaxID=181762 RepID=A0ACB8HFS8_PSICU|nr:Chromatin-remodeling ATPase INO80 [Psilocybe cubensis]KAH9486801.1 Chromatin-remodeling ATPase INO80 [Psilocybe cubensis]
MSLRHILNDEPHTAHSRQAFAATSRMPSGEPPVFPEDRTLSPHPGSPSPPYLSPRHSREPLSSSRTHYRSSAQNDLSRDSRSGDWTAEEHPSYPIEHRSYSYDEDSSVVPVEPQHNYPPEGESDVVSKKRRKGGDKMKYAVFEPTNPRRMSLRKKVKETRPVSPSNESDDVNKVHNSTTGAVEEVTLDSSDLEDCREIWADDLRDYALETKQRQQSVAQYFWASIVERNSITALNLSRHYSSKIENIPTTPPTPPLAPAGTSFEDDFENMTTGGMRSNGQERDHHRRYNSSAEDAALEFERSMLQDSPGPQPKKKGDKKRPMRIYLPPTVPGDDNDEIKPAQDAPGPSAKRRKLDNETPSSAAGNGMETPVNQESVSLKLSISKLKGKGKQVQREASHDSVSVTPKTRRKPGPKKKGGIGLELENEQLSRPSSIHGDITPAVSRPNSPGPANITMVYELDETIPPMKRAKKVDDAAMMKRIKSLEEAQRKVWTNIARRDVAKVYKYHVTGYQTRQSQLERIAKLASMQARKPFTRTAKANKDLQAKAKRLMREMQVFWKKNEKEERDVRKREQKEALDRIKVEEEKREAARQARKLEFLISQTELYSHFVGSKLKTTEIEGDSEEIPLPAGAHVTDAEDPQNLPEIDFNDADSTNLHRHARHNAQEAIALAKERALQFDAQAALDRKTNEALKLAKAQAHIHEPESEEATTTSTAPLVDLDSDELNFQNPTSLSGPLTIGQPRMLMAQLKEYQLKGLNWLATLYEQGINGILADEMGLGKTVQSISLLAYLAETHDIWGPFLVVAPASTLHNWQQELTRFVPRLKALPYWGNVKDRATLRKFWSKKEISYDQDAPFHVLITSYQLVTQDQQYFQRVKWQYMILDEAQNIKNSSSVRWKTLLGFHCRNRLLLTGTPIQNSMQELWALLHFIMPSLFDSHDEFNEWFSKDIENAAENKGSKLNEHQLRRLHMILKPFMLRRVKRHVQNELSEKIEIDIYVDLSPRQRNLYAGLLANVSVADLLEKAANIGDADSARSLMNLVMQFRKVCNHPELFERADVVAPYSFCNFGRSGPLMREGDFLMLPYSTRSPIEYSIPQLLYKEGGLIHVPSETSIAPSQSGCLVKLLNIWSTDWIHRSLYEDDQSSFSFLRFLNMTPTEAHRIHNSPLIRRRLMALEVESSLPDIRYSTDPDFSAYDSVHYLQISSFPVIPKPDASLVLPDLLSISRCAWQSSCLSRPAMHWYTPSAVAPSISLYCNDRTFLESEALVNDAPLETLAMYGLPHDIRDSEQACDTYEKLLPGLPPVGLVGISPSDQLPASTMQVPEAKSLIYDSAKLARLDSLLQELKSNDHRVLVYFQMTRMMDLMEEYLIYRQYKYLRLDGSSKLEDRRDMVIDWQTRPDIFVFLLSTRAGGLGINLTAADTVVFYDHDWNPSNDAQAMDRAHRLGQTRQVTVYRLITKGTIDERIVQLARVKKDVQDIVVGNKNFTDVTKPSEIVQLLLNDEQLASLESNRLPDGRKDKSDDSGKEGQATVRDLWNEEGDDFFGHTASAPTEKPDEENTPAVSQSTRGKRRKVGATGATRGRKPGPKKKIASNNVDIPLE